MNQFRFGLCLLVALMVATCGAHAGLAEIRNRFRGMHNNAAAEAAYYPQQQALATAQVQQPSYRPAQAPLYRGQAAQPAYVSSAMAAATASSQYAPPQPAAYPPQREQYVQQPYYAPAPVVHAPVPRVAPRFVPHAAPRFSAGAVSSSAALGGGASASAAGAGQGGSAVSTAAAAGAGGHGAGASSAVAGGSAYSAQKPMNYDSRVVDTEELNEHYNEPETLDSFGTQSGSYANDGKGLETSSYVRNTENLEKHEDGKEDDDHYYNAQSYGKTYDENKHEAFNNDDEDILHTPTVFRKKKSNTNYVSDFNKARRESGSGVLAHDKHSASYNKNMKKFNENVDQRYRKEGEGLIDSQDFSSESHIDDEDEEQTDNHGLGTFVGVDGVQHAKRPSFYATQAAAAAAAGGANGNSASAAAASVRS